MGFSCSDEPKETVPALAQETSTSNLVKYPSYEIVAEYPHDSTLFTEGLFFEQGYLYESGGMRGHSRLVKYLPGADISKEKRLSQYIFAEGISPLKDKIYMLTYTEGKCMVFDKATFKQIKEFNYIGEGWGLSHHKGELYMSDGSSVIKILDPKTFTLNRTINVSANGSTVNNINELEFAKGYLYANVWQRPEIIKIDISTGNVVAIYNMSELIGKVSYNFGIDVLNGIAYDAKEDVFYITGKFWPKLFKIKLSE
jgi:glutamine cyclotransferase